MARLATKCEKSVASEENLVALATSAVATLSTVVNDKMKMVKFRLGSSNCPVVSVEFADNWLRKVKKAKLIHWTVLGNLLALVEQGLAVLSQAFPSRREERKLEKKKTH